MRAALAVRMTAALLLPACFGPSAGSPSDILRTDGATASVATDDGLRLTFDGARLVGAAVDGHSLRNSSSTAEPGGFRVRSYTSPSPPGAELLANPTFASPGETEKTASDWVGVGGGYRRQIQDDGTPSIVLHNAQTNLSAGAAQDVALSDELWRPQSGTEPIVLRLSGWAAAEGLRSQGTCADDGSCRLHDAFSVSATLTYTATDGTRQRTVLPAASFQSGSHEPEHSFAVLELPPILAELPDSQHATSDVSGGAVTGRNAANASLRVVIALNGYAGTVMFTNVSLVRMPWSHFVMGGVDGGGLTRLNASAIHVEAVTQPLGINGLAAAVPPLALDAIVSARASHIRIDGKVMLRHAPATELQSAAGDDHALTIQFVVPVEIDDKTECWQLGIDAHTALTVPSQRRCNNTGATEEHPGRGMLHGRRQRGYYDGAGEEGTVEGEDMVPPLPSGASTKHMAYNHAASVLTPRAWCRLVPVATTLHVAASSRICRRSK